MDTIETLAVEQKFVPLSLCRYGIDYPGGSINPRKTNRGASDQLIASIREDGIIQPLLGREKDGLYYFAAGDRRLNALFRIHAAARRPDDTPIVWDSVKHIQVPIILRHAGNPLELGMQENLNRNDLHPVDKMEGFAAMLAGRPEEGIAALTVEEIAARFSMRPAQVRQSLRLGALAPSIRDLWRAGKMEGVTAEAFTLCRDEKQQLKILDRLTQKVGPGGQITPHQVRHALKAQPGEVKRLLNFVTRAVYEASGHSVDETLFSLMAVTDDGQDVLGEPSVSDVAALKEIAESKLADHCCVLTKLPKSEGGPWGWAKPAGAMPAGWQSWPRMELGRRLSIKDRESVGCVVSIDGDGRLQVEEAIYWQEAKPAETPNVAAASGSDQPPPHPAPILVAGEEGAAGDSGASEGTARDPDAGGAGAAPLAALSRDAASDREGDLSPRLQQQLAEQMQAALKAALTKRNDLALPLLLAALASHGEVVAIQIRGTHRIDAQWRFAEALEKYLAMDTGAQLRALAARIGEALSITIETGETPPAFMAGPQALMKAMLSVMGAPKLKKHLLEAFDVEGYAKAAPKGVLLAAIGEACGPQQREKLAAKGKAAVQEFARVNLAERRWLPPELGADVLNVAALASRVGAKKRGR